MSRPGSAVIVLSCIGICLVVLTILAIVGGLYFKRWRLTTGSPPKLRFHNASSTSEEGAAWEEAGIQSSDNRPIVIIQEKEVFNINWFYFNLVLI